MPHLVDFLRSSSGNITHIKKTAASRTSRTSSRNASRNASRTGSPCTSDTEDHAPHAVKMPDFAEAVKKQSRLSLAFGGKSKEVKENPAFTVVAVDWSIESPPIVFYGSPEESTGALVSGQMYLDVKEDVVEVDSFVASLTTTVTQKRPYHSNCPECQKQTTEIESWQFLAHPTKLRKGRHTYPFSVLLSGHHPASMDTPLVNITYDFKAEASVTKNPGSTTASLLPAKFERTLHVKRSLPEEGIPHNSVRVFPPTNIKAAAHFNSIIHPTSTNKMMLRLDGLMSHNDKVKTVDLWKLKKVSWRLEETIKTLAPACDKHAPITLPDQEGVAPARKGFPRTEVRSLGEKNFHEGWKSDYSGNDGTVDFEFEYFLNQYKPHSRELRYACDNKTREGEGVQVTHALRLELVVSKEYAPEGKAHLANQTGTGRILRMHFGIVLTDFPGLGVSWDNEAPPVYEDVPPSPPGYPTEPTEPPIEYDDLEALDAQRSSLEPMSRRGSDWSWTG